MNKESKYHLTLGIILCILGIWIFQTSSKFPTGSHLFGPGSFPKLLAILLILFSIIMIIENINSNEQKRDVLFKMSKKKWLIFSVILLMGIFLGLINVLGYFLSSILLLLTLLFIFGERRIIFLFFLPICFTLITYFLFSILAKVSLPEGILFQYFFD